MLILTRRLGESVHFICRIFKHRRIIKNLVDQFNQKKIDQKKLTNSTTYEVMKAANIHGILSLNTQLEKSDISTDEYIDRVTEILRNVGYIDSIDISVLGINGREVRIGINASDNLGIHRDSVEFVCCDDPMILTTLRNEGKSIQLLLCLRCMKVYVIASNIKHLVNDLHPATVLRSIGLEMDDIIRQAKVNKAIFDDIENPFEHDDLFKEIRKVIYIELSIFQENDRPYENFYFTQVIDLIDPFLHLS